MSRGEDAMSFLKTCLVAGALLAATATAEAQFFRFNEGGGQMFFYEETRGRRTVWGWSESPRPFDPVASARRPRTIREACARQVGRQLQRDSTSLITSTRMTDECVARREASTRRPARGG
jgi:hypothetical protein